MRSSRPVRDRALPRRFAVVSGITASLMVGGLALLTAGQGVAAWTLMMAGIGAQVTAQLSRRHVDGRRVGSRGGAAAVLAALLGLLAAGGLAAQGVALAAPWLAVLVAMVTGVATGYLLRWWQLRPTDRPA
ncbi:hypothetical protein [Cellulomonas dongxiuzhuiae]|uniref:Uncharacterized protein n=1 Tax=Cellulomonas dongxiuzhuiae TaxID=2819979 RepID=A0ABX8GQ31_9CELL|nr:hypothetical protein [Cellulomonas dongxiuzhuiae]MBO3096106.1 hypothetical protein [Cellulomonas dongxiuzhuiae]QWC17374.1 hypothetical protein KKR89_07340 [Cellulomonas dongxiuzhuiae]